MAVFSFISVCIVVALLTVGVLFGVGAIIVGLVLDMDPGIKEICVPTAIIASLLLSVAIIVILVLSGFLVVPW